MGRAVLRHLPGPVEHVRLEQLADARPVRGERELPVGLDLGGDLLQYRFGLFVEQPQARSRAGGLLCQYGEVGAHLFRGAAADRRQFGGEFGERPGRGRVEEVREVAVARDQGGQPAAVQSRAHQPGSHLPGPVAVHGRVGLLAQQPEAGDDLPHRGHREPGLRQVRRRKTQSVFHVPAPAKTRWIRPQLNQ